MEFIDCDVWAGRARVPDPSQPSDVADLVAEMDRLDIRQAWVRHRACEEAAPDVGNAVLMAEIKGHDRCVPAWFVKPEGDEPDFDPAAQVRRMVGAGVRAAWTVPSQMAVPLQAWSYGKMLDALAAHRVPLLLRYADVPPADLHDLLAAYPTLPVVLTGVARQGRHRLLYPLMERFDNVYLCCSPAFSVHHGLEHLVGAFGSERIVFGTGYPRAEGGATVALVMYAEVSDDDRRNIAHRNAERLTAEVSHDPQ